MAVSIMGHEYYTPKDLAQLLRVSLPTAHKLVRQNRIPIIRIGSKMLFPAPEVRAYLRTTGILALEQLSSKVRNL